MKKYGILLSPEEHKQLKRLAADIGGTMQDIARDAVLAAMRRGATDTKEITNRASDEGMLGLLLVVREDLSRLVRLIDSRGAIADARSDPDATAERLRQRTEEMVGTVGGVRGGSNRHTGGPTRVDSGNKKRPANRR